MACSRALPRSYQVTPSHPGTGDERHCERKSGPPADSLKQRVSSPPARDHPLTPDVADKAKSQQQARGQPHHAVPEQQDASIHLPSGFVEVAGLVDYIAPLAVRVTASRWPRWWAAWRAPLTRRSDTLASIEASSRARRSRGAAPSARFSAHKPAIPTSWPPPGRGPAAPPGSEHERLRSHRPSRRGGRKTPAAATVDRSAYRIVQKALTNTLKHAGASRADVRLRYSSEH